MASGDAHLSATRDLIDKVPIIKSPSFWVAKPVELPPDIHPLPESVEPYFVYPFTIESHALTVLPNSLDALRSAHAQRLERLRSFSETKERARKAHLNVVAPGWSGDGGLILPSKKDTSVVASSSTMTPAASTSISLASELEGLTVGEAARPDETNDPMRAFVDGLDSLESTRSSAGPGVSPNA